MADGIFDRVYNSKNGETYEVADTFARAAIENLTALKIHADDILRAQLLSNDGECIRRIYKHGRNNLRMGDHREHGRGFVSILHLSTDGHPSGG